MATSSRSAGLASIALIAATACVVSGCSKSKSSGSADPGAALAAAGKSAAAAAGVSAPAGAAAAIAGATGKGGALDESKVCAAIKPADVQALMKATVTPVVNNPGECSYYGGDLKVDIYTNDPSRSTTRTRSTVPARRRCLGSATRRSGSRPFPAQRLRGSRLTRDRRPAQFHRPTRRRRRCRTPAATRSSRSRRPTRPPTPPRKACSATTSSPQARPS